MPLYHNTLEVEYIEDDKESLSGLSGGNQANGTNMVGAKVFFLEKHSSDWPRSVLTSPGLGVKPQQAALP